MNDEIKYHSTNGRSPLLPFSGALLRGLAPDGGLYMPDHIPSVSAEEIAGFSGYEYYEIAYEILNRFLKGRIPLPVLKELVKDAYNFEVPLENVFERKYVMRLDRGPTASFKDFAARMMGRLLQFFLQEDNRRLLILTATSGDTGSAIANAFYGLDNIGVCVLFPVNEVTERQRKQMTTLGKNVRVIGVDGKFDDCQAMVKKAFMDSGLSGMSLSSANSINIGRLLPQSVYYFYAYSRICDISKGEEITFSVPSGNFGDLMGGLFARRMGLPVRKFIVATNENDEVPKYLETGVYKTLSPSRNCLSSAMNVGHPSNMARVIELYGGNMNEKGGILREPDMNALRKDLYSVSISDMKTKETITDAYKRYGLVLEPHGAVGWAALEDYLSKDKGEDQLNNPFVVLETAHPAKFPEQIRELLGFDPELPPSLKGIEEKTESYEKISNVYEDFKKILLDNYPV